MNKNMPLKDNVLLTTLFSGFNFGSSLQTFATKVLVENLGYNCELIERQSLVKGRDVRMGKLFTILFRTLQTFDTRTIKAYRSSYQKVYSEILS